MLAHQALAVGGDLSGQMQDVSQVSVLLSAPDMTDRPKDSMSLQNLGFKCANKKLFAQPMVQAYFLNMWHEGERAVAGDMMAEQVGLSFKVTAAL